MASRSLVTRKASSTEPWRESSKAYEMATLTGSSKVSWRASWMVTIGGASWGDEMEARSLVTRMASETEPWMEFLKEKEMENLTGCSKVTCRVSWIVTSKVS